MTVLPGFVDVHGHNGDPQKAPNATYGYKLWLAHGVTSVLGVPFYFGDPRGLVVSDDLDMKAVVDHVGVADAAVRAIAAGCDALLLCQNRAYQDEAFEGLVRSCERDSEFRARVALAAAGIRLLKQRLDTRPPAPPLSILGQAAPLASELAG